jgi:hypothetical protein
MERGAVRRDSEVRVALIQRIDRHSELQEATDASRVGGARELGQQRAALLHQLAHEPGLALRDRPHGRRVVSRTRGDQPLHSRATRRVYILPLERSEHVAAAPAHRDRDARCAIAGVADERFSCQGILYMLASVTEAS